MNNRFEKRGAANSTNMNNNDNTCMTAREKRVLRSVIKKALVAMTVIMTVISKSLPAVIRWVKQLKNCNDEQRLTLKSLFATCLGEATLVGMPVATRNLLKTMDAPRPIIALTDNRKVIWLLNYIMDTYSMVDVKQVGLLAAQAAALGATIEEETNNKSYLRLEEPDMSEEEVRNL